MAPQVWEGREAELLPTLPESERARLQAIRAPARRLQSLATQVLLWRALAERLGAPPGAWRLRRDEAGRPFLEGSVGAPPPQLSLAHLPGRAACALARERVGVDLQRVGRARRPLALARRYFPAEEADQLASGSPEAPARSFARRWALKEAWGKAAGVGVPAALGAVAFRGEPERPTPVFVPGVGPEASGGWSFRMLEPGPDEVLAVALRHPGPLALRIHPVSG